MTKHNDGIARTLITFTVPLILSGLLQQLYNWADAFIVGNIVGEGALAAVGATNAITGLFVMAITGFTSGISILSARFYGAGDMDVQKKLLFSFTALLGVFFLAVSVAGILGTQGMLRLLDTPADIFEMAADYLAVILVGVPFLAVYNVYAAVLRGLGNSKAPFYGILVSSVANVALDLLFVGAFHWSVVGAAVATVISQALMTVFLVIYAVRKYEALRFRPDRALFEKGVIRQGWTISWPITVQSVMKSVGSLVLQNFMNGFGTATVAAITTAYRVDSVIMLPILNLSTGIATMTSQNIGAGEPGRARRCLSVGMVMMTAVSLALTALVMVLGGPLVQIFGVTPEAVAIGRAFFQAIGIFYVIYGAAMALRGYVEGRGFVLFSGICGILSLGVRIGLSYGLVGVFEGRVIAYAEAFSWVFMFLMYGAWYVLNRRREQKPGTGIELGR